MKAIFISLMLVFASALSMNAQQSVVLNKELDSFDKIEISDEFLFTIRNSSSFSVRIVVDKRISEFVRPIVKNGVFSIELDKKKYPSELKKELKAKGAVEPELKIEIFTPHISELTLENKAVLLDSDVLQSDNFKLNVSHNARINKMSVDCVSADMEFENSSISNINVQVKSKLNVKTSNSAVANISQKGGNSILETKGSSILNISAEVLDIEVDAAGTSEIHISGNTSTLSVESSGLSHIDAEALEAVEGDFEMSGNTECNINVEERVKVELTNGATLTFKRTPVIEVERIINSTVMKADDPKRK